MSWWLIGIAILTVVLALSAWWWLPKWEAERLRLQIRDRKARAEIEDNLRKSIGQLIGGAFVIIGAGLALWGTQQNLHSQEDQSKRNIGSQQLSKAMDLLTEEDREVKRLGGVYVLEGLINNQPEYSETALETLCEFVRYQTERKVDEGPPAHDVQTALNVIKSPTSSHKKCVMAGARIPKADLEVGHLMSVDLKNAKLAGAKMQLIELSNVARLDNADLSGADLYNAKLEGAFLYRANLMDACPINANFRDALLIGAHLNNADFNNADLTRADLQGADLEGTQLDFANLSDVRNLSKDQLEKACGTKVTLPPGLDSEIKPCPSSIKKPSCK